MIIGPVWACGPAKPLNLSLSFVLHLLGHAHIFLSTFTAPGLRGTLPVTVEATRHRAFVLLSARLYPQFCSIAVSLEHRLCVMDLTGIMTFSHPRILQVWELLLSSFCKVIKWKLQEIKKNLQGQTSHKWWTQVVKSHSLVLDSAFLQLCYSVSPSLPSSQDTL